MSALVPRLPTIDALTSRDGLSEALGVGAVASVRVEPLSTAGYSGSTHQRLMVTYEGGRERSFVVKTVDIAHDWTLRVSDDNLGREAALLGAPELLGVWETFHRPYLAYAVQSGGFALLMEDLSDHLFPDVDEPISLEAEEAALSSLAGLHARYWESEVLNLPWLTRATENFGAMGPHALDSPGMQVSAPELREMMRRGWEACAKLLPADIFALLSWKKEEFARLCEGLPKTLVHGDAKVGNFAFMPDKKIAAFDWAMVGVAPPTVDLGWYLAINASRLARTKEEVVLRYRELLEGHLGRPLDEKLWTRMLDIGILYGAVMLLWTKALSLASMTSTARREWSWWVSRLNTIRGSLSFDATVNA